MLKMEYGFSISIIIYNISYRIIVFRAEGVYDNCDAVFIVHDNKCIHIAAAIIAV